MIRLSERGSMLLESTGALLALSVILIAGLCILYMSFVRVWIDRQVYEGIVCLASTAHEAECERALRKQILYALPVGELRHVQLSRTAYEASVRLSYHLADQNVMAFGERRRLPLLTGARP